MIENLTSKFIRKPIKIIGCGLAGAEVAFILANHGFDVHIFDNGQNIPNDKFCYYDKYEIFLTENMKYELECLNSPLFSIAKKYGFDRFGFEYNENFMKIIKKELESNPRIKIFDATIDLLSETETTVIATGHNTSRALITELENYIGKMHVCYFQPQKMVVDADSFDKSELNFVSKSKCFLNLTEEEYNNFYKKLKEVDESYKNCESTLEEKQITVESLARRGAGGLRNSIMRPYFDGLAENGQRPYASLKMTYHVKENVFILDDFFSGLDEDAQKAIIETINTLRGCKILRYSQVKRRTYLLAPTCITDELQIVSHPNIYVCGGFLGTEGSFESLLTANYCAYSLIAEKKLMKGLDFLAEKTCIGLILNNLLKKSVVNFRLFNLKYDIISYAGLDTRDFDRQVENQKFLSKSQIEKFKEKFYGNYF